VVIGCGSDSKLGTVRIETLEDSCEYIFINSSKPSESGCPSASVLHEGLSIPRLRDQNVTKSDIVWNGLRNAKVTWICSILHIGSHSVSQIMEGEMGGAYGTMRGGGGKI